MYGEHDPWSAAAADPARSRDNLVVYATGRGHEADLTMLSDADRARVIDRLAEWANTKLVAPQALQIDADRLGRRRAAEAWTLSHARSKR